jgi:hypothetical protein
MRNWKGCSGGPSFRWGQGFSLHVELEQPRAGFIGFLEDGEWGVLLP